MSRSTALLALALVAAACGERAPAPPPRPAVDARPCAERLLADHAIDVSPEPRVCDALAEALRPLSPASLAEVRDLIIVRDARGPCADACPDLAYALMSDAALAFYRIGAHELHVVDATFAGPRWRGGTPVPEAIADYLAQLGLPDWESLVARVRALPDVTLPAHVPVGDPALFDAIVQVGPRVLLGGDVPLADLLRHELGHAVLLRAPLESARIRPWGTLSGWTASGGEPADGYVRGVFALERPIVASRLLLGLPRGDDAHYTPHRPGLPTPYAAFDPMEDHAESFRLVHADPIALGRTSPARLVALAGGVVDLGAPALRGFVRPGVAALLAPEIDPRLAMPALRALGSVLVAEAADLADPRPLPVPAGTHPDVRAALDELQLVVELDGHTFRPSDAAVQRLLDELERGRAGMEDLSRVLEEN